MILAGDELGTLKEHPEETHEDVLRRELKAKDLANTKVCLFISLLSTIRRGWVMTVTCCYQLLAQIESLQTQLRDRPTLEGTEKLRDEIKSLELILSATQHHNEKAMAELERFVFMHMKETAGLIMALLGPSSARSCLSVS